ncbi:MAG: DNA polymerase III subunit delta [Clostridiaceae bacterium]|nr:DNA polymerase III subunit delta [Clostridiaceae bacterium]
MAVKKSAGKAIQNYAQTKAQLRSDELHDVYLFFGEEDFLIERLVLSIQAMVLAPASADLDRVRLDAEGYSSRLDLDKLKAEIQTPPFMSRRKLIIVKNSTLFTAGSAKKSSISGNDDSDNDEKGTGTGSHKDRQQMLTELLKMVNEQVCLIFVEQKADKRLKSLLSAVQEKGIIAEMAQEKPAVLKQWVEAECRQKGLSIRSQAAESLVDRCEQSMRVIWSELEKLFLYAEYTGLKTVDEETVALVSLPDLRGNIFDLTDSISSGDTGRALILLDTLVRQRQPLQLIQFMFARHFRQLICAADTGQANELINKLKIMPFVAARLIKQSRQFSIPVMERIYELCFESDMMVKTGKMNDRLVLETMIVRAGEAAGAYR